VAKKCVPTTTRAAHQPWGANERSHGAGGGHKSWRAALIESTVDGGECVSNPTDLETGRCCHRSRSEPLRGGGGVGFGYRDAPQIFGDACGLCAGLWVEKMSGAGAASRRLSNALERSAWAVHDAGGGLQVSGQTD